ncbi:unnamed protein product [Nezara viridula]|uniref:carbonic anhydrase n=1 Tax=Nezara viridula TaxID=85310 RepID=A0A9P0E852_NEZVI|nr:unnamed protein product [Nezara viridula]
MQEEEVSSIQEKKGFSHEAMVTMTEKEYNDLEKEYIEEKEAERINAENIEAEKKNAEKTMRHILNWRIRKGCRPSKTIQELLTNWIEQYEDMERPTVIKLSNREVNEQIHTDVIPEFCHYDKSYYVNEAMKWKTKKDKYRGEYKDSPVNIETDKVKKCKYYRKLIITGLWEKDKLITMCNAGDSVRGTISGEVLLSSGPLFGNYKFQEFSLKFGDTNNNGTDHSINGQRFALEFHMNFYQISYKECPPRVLRTRSRNAVLVILFQESQEPQYYELFSLISHLNKTGKKITITDNILYDFKNVLSSSEYYNYVGSSSEKPYLPNVEWFIFKKIQPIHKTQMELLWQLRKTGTLKPTFHQIQPIGERIVFEPSYKYHEKCRGKPICEC